MYRIFTRARSVQSEKELKKNTKTEKTSTKQQTKKILDTQCSSCSYTTTNNCNIDSTDSIDFSNEMDDVKNLNFITEQLNLSSTAETKNNSLSVNFSLVDHHSKKLAEEEEIYKFNEKLNRLRKGRAALLSKKKSKYLRNFGKNQTRKPKMSNFNFINPKNIHKSVAPLSKAVEANNTLYISGQIGCDDDRNFPETIQEQTEMCLKNMEKVLNAAGMDFSNLVKVTVMYTDINDWPGINQVYMKKFEAGRYPARTAFHSAFLPLGTKVEMDGIAVRY